MMDQPSVEEKPLDAEMKPISQHSEVQPEKEVQKKKRKKSKKIPKAKGENSKHNLFIFNYIN